VLASLREVGPERIPAKLQLRGVLPLVGIADLDVQLCELLDGFLLGVRSHPGERGQVFFHHRDEVVHQRSCLRLGGWRKVFICIGPADGFTEQLLGELAATLGAWTHLGGASQALIAKGKRLFDERLGQPRRRGVEETPAQVRLPGCDRRGLQLLVDLLEELGSRDVDGLARDSRLVEVPVPFDAGRQRLELRKRGLVLDGRRIGGGLGVERGVGQALLEGDHAVGRGQRVFLSGAAEHQDARDVLTIFFPELGLRVGVPVQAMAAGSEVQQVVGRLAVLERAGLSKRRGDADVEQSPHGALYVRDRLRSVDIGEQRRQRREARCVDRGFIHAGGVVITNELLVTPGWPIGLRRDLLDQRIDLLLVGRADDAAAAVPRLACGDGVLRAPGAVGIFVEVGARIGVAIHVARLNPLLRRDIRRRVAGSGDGIRRRRHVGGRRRRRRAARRDQRQCAREDKLLHSSFPFESREGLRSPGRDQCVGPSFPLARQHERAKVHGA
jgi:hypothetical protein